jgi:hypothetical protein
MMIKIVLALVALDLTIAAGLRPYERLIVLALVVLDMTILCAKDELSRIADALEERNKRDR